MSDEGPREGVQPEPAGGRKSRGLGLASAGYLLLTTLVLYPAPLRFFSHYLGFGDLWQHLWNRWWFSQALGAGVSPYWTDLQYFPDGASLAAQSFSELNVLLGLLLEPLVGPIASYNLLVVFAYVLSGTGAYLLVHELSRDRVAAWIAGVAFAFSPFRVSHLMFLHIQSTQWLPLFAWSLVRLRREPTIRRTVVCAVFFALAGATSKYFLLFLALFAALLVLYQLVTVRRPAALRFATAVVAAGVLGALLVSPLIWPLLREGTTDSDAFHLGFETTFSADLVSFFVPAEHHPLFGRFLGRLYETFNADAREKVSYLGWSLLLLAVVAIGSKPRERASALHGFWWITLAVFTLLSLGPHLQILGRISDAWQMPYGWIDGLPFLSLIRAPSRFLVVATLGLAVLAGRGASWLTGRFARLGAGAARLKPVVVVFLTSVVLLDLWTWSPVPLTRPVVEPALAEPLPATDGEALLEIPMPYIFNSKPLSHQIQHGKPMLGGYVSREPQEALSFVRSRPFLWMNREHPDSEFTGKLFVEEARDAHELFSSQEIGWVLVSLEPPSPTTELMSRWLEGVFGPPERASETMRIFRVDRTAPVERYLQSPLLDERLSHLRDPVTSQWYGLSGFHIALPNGDYQVALRLSEIFFDEPGKRLFNVLLEGRTVERQLDVFARVGQLRPLQLVYDVRLEDELLQVDFRNVLNLAVLNGIAIRRDGRTIFNFYAQQAPGQKFDGSFGYVGRAIFDQTRLDPPEDDSPAAGAVD